MFTGNGFSGNAVLPSLSEGLPWAWQREPQIIMKTDERNVMLQQDQISE
jgi:hypothetical protein